MRKSDPMAGAELERFRALCADEPTPGPTCAVCGGVRRPERARNYAGEAAELDPFCSSACARAYHGTTLRLRPSGPSGERVEVRDGR
jgi:hypothetical protein